MVNKITPTATFQTEYHSRIIAHVGRRFVGSVLCDGRAYDIFGHYIGETWGEALADGRLDVSVWGIVAWPA